MQEEAKRFEKDADHPDYFMNWIWKRNIRLEYNWNRMHRWITLRGEKWKWFLAWVDVVVQLWTWFDVILKVLKRLQTDFVIYVELLCFMFLMYCFRSSLSLFLLFVSFIHCRLNYAQRTKPEFGFLIPFLSFSWYFLKLLLFLIVFSVIYSTNVGRGVAR